MLAEFAQSEALSMVQNNDQAAQSVSNPYGGTNGLRGLDQYAGANATYTGGTASTAAFGTSGTGSTTGLHSLATYDQLTSNVNTVGLNNIAYKDVINFMYYLPQQYWTANAKFEWDYNKLYDVFYRAGVPIHSMRVASPFMSEAKSSLCMYRIIDPHIWARLCARVQGANFVATYGKQLDYKSISLPEGHTWKSFVKFLLDTLPKESAENFKMRFAQSIKFWARVGRGLRDDIIEDLDKNGIKYHVNGTTPHGSKMLKRIRIVTPPDHVDSLKGEHSSVTSWKRFAITILKNDHVCKTLGFSFTKEQLKKRNEIIKKYKELV
jgi:predicted phosphoadenosine phosphosulfate sulfurtransferase